MFRSLRLYNEGKQVAALDISSSIEFTLRRNGVNASVYDIPYYRLRQDTIAYLGTEDREYLMFHSEYDANITVCQPIMFGGCKSGVIWNEVTPPTDLVDGAILYSYVETDTGIDHVKTPALLWRYDEYNNYFECDDAVEGEEYILYLVTSVRAKGGAIPMARRIAENIDANKGMRYTSILCDCLGVTSFYFGVDQGGTTT